MNCRSGLMPAALILLIGSRQSAGQSLSPAEQEKYLLTAKITSTREIGTGVTKPIRATLSDGKLEHDAQIQVVNNALSDLFAPNGTPVPWRDSYLFNIAAYKLDGLIGLRMVPVSVVRSVNKRPGAMTWWVDDVLMVELDRLKKEVKPPDERRWAQQLSLAATFDQLIYNVDRNLGNLIITKDWRLVLIDHTRAFAPNPQLMQKEHFDRCSRTLLAGLRKLNRSALDRTLSDCLTARQRSTILVRRDLIVKHFDKLIAEKGEKAVLFD